MPPIVAAALVLVATRHDPLLSPDSITYLSAAAHVRSLDGLIDFTLEPLTVFGPVFPLLLAPGGRSLLWAKLIGAASIAAAAALMWMLVRMRVREPFAVAAALALGASQGLVRMASVVWSEAPYAVISIGMLAVLSRRPMRTRVAAIGGLVAGVGFLTRYAGVGLLITGVAMVIVSLWPAEWSAVSKRCAAFIAGAVGVSAIWIVRNLVATGQSLGPRFEGGTREGITETIYLALSGTGQIVIGDGWTTTGYARLGAVLLVAIAVIACLAIRSGRATTLDIGMAVFAVSSFVLPILARRVTANDIEMRVMSPMLVPIVYYAAISADRVCTRRIITLAGASAFTWWCYQGVAFAARFPDLAPGGSGYRAQYAPELYDVIDDLPDDAIVLTNSPQRVWWFTEREPTLMGFTRPRPGNSHYPLDAADTLDEACSGRAYLAWFDGLQNAGDGPAERRPDLLGLVELQLQQAVPGGELYLLAPVDAGSC